MIVHIARIFDLCVCISICACVFYLCVCFYLCVRISVCACFFSICACVFQFVRVFALLGHRSPGPRRAVCPPPVFVADEIAYLRARVVRL